MHDDRSTRTDAATTAFSREQDAAEFSPAQPEGANRIDDDADPGNDDAAPHTKHEHGDRMKH